MAATGMLETETDNVYLRITGIFEQLEGIRLISITANGHTFRLGDIASQFAQKLNDDPLIAYYT